ncbi:MAG: hypothetical protein H6818_10405 [Phycisphaerales bacterium]|nr:hypothetical protein [Phycisphaerales bacterium]MCB9863887.1 hypothetical protein [Phycisphaerales bacterium]
MRSVALAAAEMGLAETMIHDEQCRRWVRVALVAAVALAPIAGRAWADDAAKKKGNLLDQIKTLQEKAKSIENNWSIEAMRLKEAHQIMFQRNGWTSESDQFALNLINEISTYGPFEAEAREGVFLNGVQSRFGLSEDQVDLLNDEMRSESIAFTVKHFDKLMPVAMEAVQAKAAGEPFTPEMIAKWSRQLEPVMEDALAGVNRVKDKLEATMDESQKAMLEKDMAAVVKRHNDIKTQVQKWKRGEWTPYDFGMENDPTYASVIREYLPPKDKSVPNREELVVEVTRRDQSLWAKYVADFVNKYDCDEGQRNAAAAILKDSESEAAKHLSANGEDLEYHERRAKESPSERKRAYHTKKAEELRRPIGMIFDRMCRRLESNVLNREQRRQLAADKAKGKKAGNPAKGKTASRGN